MEKCGLATALIIIALASALTLSVGRHQLGAEEASERLTARRALAQSIGFASLAVSSECTLARTLMEGLSGCLGDVAGGYCTYSSCDVVMLPDIQTESASHLRIVRDGEDERGEAP